MPETVSHRLKLTTQKYIHKTQKVTGKFSFIHSTQTQYTTSLKTTVQIDVKLRYIDINSKSTILQFQRRKHIHNWHYGREHKRNRSDYSRILSKRKFDFSQGPPQHSSSVNNSDNRGCPINKSYVCSVNGNTDSEEYDQKAERLKFINEHNTITQHTDINGDDQRQQLKRNHFLNTQISAQNNVK